MIIPPPFRSPTRLCIWTVFVFVFELYLSLYLYLYLFRTQCCVVNYESCCKQQSVAPSFPIFVPLFCVSILLNLLSRHFNGNTRTSNYLKLHLLQWSCYCHCIIWQVMFLTINWTKKNKTNTFYRLLACMLVCLLACMSACLLACMSACTLLLAKSKRIPPMASTKASETEGDSCACSICFCSSSRSAADKKDFCVCF